MLPAEANKLDEVVVIGYRSVKKTDLTGSVGVVKASELQERPSSSLNQAFAGRISGVQVNTNSGRQPLQTKHLLFPIPAPEIKNNPNLTPNPSY